jgi:adenosylmethionine-8-amino-7-oxononanoate aminotransferase
MSNVFPRHSKWQTPVAASGEGCHLIDAAGKRYLNVGDAAVSCLGHGDPDVTQAIKDQLDNIAFAHSGFLTSEPAEELAQLLIEYAPDNLEKVYFVSGGSEAVEAAIKLTRQYFLEKGEPKRHHLIARRQSYHGNTLGALAAGGNQWRRKQFDPLLINVSHIAPCYEYFDRGDDETPEAYGLRVANELEDEINRVGPENVMAFIAEPVVGATMGAVTAVPGYFKRIREICDTHGIMLILDEVMCGMGRTGHLFAVEAEGINPDILCIAKGLGAGYQPIGAMLCSADIYAAIENGSGFFQHGHTYIGHPVATAAGLAVVKALLRRHLIERVREKGPELMQILTDRFGQHPYIGDIRGRGMFIGIEIVKDRVEKTPFEPALKLAAKFKRQAFENGLICYPMSGTRDGLHGDHILLAPPFIISDAEMLELVDKLDKTFAEVLPD